MMKRKKIIQEGEVTPEQIGAAEEMFAGLLPGIGPLFKFFN